MHLHTHLFSYLGKIPKDILIGLIILIIGPLLGAPRTETVTYASLTPFLPDTPWKHPIISLIYFSIIFYIARKPGSLVDIVGRVLSPIKIGTFLLLIILAIFIICCIFEKSDYDRMKEAEKLPPFTKEEAERYYYTELKSKQK